jgi:hypothetical protein
MSNTPLGVHFPCQLSWREVIQESKEHILLIGVNKISKNLFSPEIDQNQSGYND